MDKPVGRLLSHTTRQRKILTVSDRFREPADPLERFLRIAIVSFVIAALSWHAFEAPINRWKTRFPYDPP